MRHLTAWSDLASLELLPALAVSDARAQPPEIRSFLLIFGEDPRFDSLPFMPITQTKRADRGVTFTNAIVTTPLCRPFRASFLAEGYLARNTGGLTNSPPSGGLQPGVRRP